MKSFLKYVLATVIGVFIVAIFLCFTFFAAVIALNTKVGETPKVRDNSVLRLTLDKPIRDRVSMDSPFGKINPFGRRESLIRILQAIRYAKNDDKIKGISIEPGATVAGITQLGEIRRAIANFEKSGKFVLAYSDRYSQGGYYVSTEADSIYTSPLGTVDLKGLSASVAYFKDFGDRYGVHFEVIRHGKFKAAVEPFLQDTMSAANREQLTALLGSIWKNTSKDIAQSRGLRDEAVQIATDSLYGLFTDKAQQVHLIDKAIYRDAYEDILRNRLGLEPTEKISFVSPESYRPADQSSHTSDDQIAVVFAQGEIVYNRAENENFIGQVTFQKTFKALRENKNVKAVVLRINSPGGSALASELIWREIALTKKRKPVVVSMGDYAASGGYYIACGADEIFAEPNTITGSIGVFSILPDAKALASHHGVQTAVVQTNAHSHQYGLTTGISQSFRKILQKCTANFYDTFISRVAEGRGLPKAYVDSIAQGRVWAAGDALRLKLIDRLGTLDAAIAAAAESANISDYEVVDYPKYREPILKLLDELTKGVGIQAKGELLQAELGAEGYKAYTRLKRLGTYKGPIALLPFTLHFD
ncbi:MAG: signal peptide peptidase SppA [Flavobacteriales bacterium]